KNSAPQRQHGVDRSLSEPARDSDSVSPHADILALQRTIGNRAVVQLLQAGAFQAKLAVSQPGDVYEQEADRVADQVMRMRERIPLGASDASHSRIQRKCTECS